MTSRDNRLSVDIGGVSLQFPVVIASGVWPYDRELWAPSRLNGVGALCTKAVTFEPRSGNPGNRIWETSSGVLNSIGLQNDGVDLFVEKYLPVARSSGIPFVVNVAMERPEETELTLKKLNSLSDLIPGVELNISCPNVDGGGMSWGILPESAAEAVSLARRSWDGPLWVKLTPQSSCLEDVARAAESEGADALVVGNTWLGMAIDVQACRPVFERTRAGLSGPAVFPLALRTVWDVSSAVDIPVVGCGGVTSAEDCLAMMMAGASAVEVGTAMFVDLETPLKICEGLAAYLDKKDISRLDLLVGSAKVN
jgi:dihydroorotate dehydrogenase (NAD+) catalytic subunit